jgi:hypothetical protein
MRNPNPDEAHDASLLQRAFQTSALAFRLWVYWRSVVSVTPVVSG